MFPLAQLPHRSARACIHQQLKSAKSLQRNHCAYLDRISSQEQRVIAHGYGVPVAIQQAKLWTTMRARNWLGMETPIQGILVFLSALLAHEEAVHRGVRAVIGQPLN